MHTGRRSGRREGLLVMTQNTRIVVNAVASYGRSLLALGCGLFSSRWILEALGQSDLGIFGVVGGLIGFITFFNGLMAGSTGRFYGYYVGVAQAEGTGDGLEIARKWFNTSLSIHIPLSILLLAIGYPIGVWAVRNWLVIPPDRIEGAVWIFRFTCLTAFLSMASIPFSAMFYAKQYIVELTIYSIATTVLNFVFSYYMVSHPGDWLVRYGAWSCVLTIIPSLLINIRAVIVFKECRLRKKYLFLWGYLKELFSYSGFSLILFVSALLRGHGISLVLNKAFGTSVNAAQGISERLNSYTVSLSESLWGALSPAITNALGEGNIGRVWRLALSAEKVCLVFSYIFCIPLCLELNEILKLWLKNPPKYIYGLVLCGIVSYIICVIRRGHDAVINASGKIAGKSIAEGIVTLFVVPIAIILIRGGFGPYSVGYAVVIVSVMTVCIILYYARRLFRCSIFQWFSCVLIPGGVLFFITTLAGFSTRFFLKPSLVRIIVTTLICEGVLFCASWWVILSIDERNFLKERYISKWISKFRHISVK